MPNLTVCGGARRGQQSSALRNSIPPQLASLISLYLPLETRCDVYECAGRVCSVCSACHMTDCIVSRGARPSPDKGIGTRLLRVL